MKTLKGCFMYKILILEDDLLFLETLEDFLTSEGFFVDIAKNSNEALELNYKNSYDLYIFDINLPEISGLELLKLLRDSNDKTATIFLTSYKDSDTLKDAFLKGCDDYIKKPVDLDELLLRVKAVLKRVNKSFEKIILEDGLIFDQENRRLHRDNIDVSLAIKAMDLLELFVQNQGKIVSKDEIITKLWGFNESYSEGSIRVYINQIKKLFKKENVIQNIKSVGYRFEL